MAGLGAAAIKIAGGVQSVGGGVGAGASLLGSLGSANPYLAGFNALSSLFGGGRVKVSGANSFGEVSSGLANFQTDDEIGINSALLDFNNPVKVLLIGAAVVGAIYFIKRGRK